MIRKVDKNKAIEPIREPKLSLPVFTYKTLFIGAPSSSFKVLL